MIDCLTMSSDSDTLSGSVGCSGSSSRQSRVRTVRLVRPNSGTLPPPGLTCRHGPGLGFSIRGGREHGTGFFVSNVELGSEAHRQGLKIGDQIIRINGFTVEDAVHKEVLQLISNHTHLTLKVRSVGMIPVKDKSTDPLSWQIIPDYGHMISESPLLEDKNHDVRINIAVAQRAKLGCGICKGPEWKPGIFVQFTKEGGIAREAGLRPGDQILYCNNIDFSDISFNEAVNVMKTSRHLELLVRKGAGSELFPGESSGYNSSASSVTGDQSPSWSESKRLSIVKEESLELEDRLSQLDFRYKPKNWDKLSYDWDDSPRHFKPTIINLSENGTTIKNNGTADECQNEVTPPCPPAKPSPRVDMTLQQHDTKTVVVEVHRSDIEDNEKENNLRKSPSTGSFTSLVSRSSSTTNSSLSSAITMELQRRSEGGGFSSVASRSSTSTSSSLSSAIAMELQRRSEKKKEAEKQIDIEEELQKNKILKGVDTQKKHQHDKLMDEFRKAHRKMFNSSNTDSSKDANSSTTDDKNNEKSNEKESLADRLANCRQQIERRTSLATPDEVRENGKMPVSSTTSLPPSTRRHIVDNSTATPPPPPPMPPLETSTSISSPTSTPPIKTTPKPSTKPKAPPVPQKVYNNVPPPCPAPDYDTLSLNTNNTLPRQKVTKTTQLNGLYSNAYTNSHPYNDEVDMESLESFKINHPASIKPKPPNTYFNNRPASTPSSGNSSQNSTISKKSRPVSVTIGEYPSGANRRLPSKFDFLNGGSSEGDSSETDSQPITSRLASELAQTLSRSNLRKRTESLENIFNESGKPQKGTVTISVNNTNGTKTSPMYLNNNHKVLMKSQSTDVTFNRNVENISNMLANRVTIKIADTDRKNEAPNGILKNGNGNQCSTQHKPLLHQKSITFGEITTVINDQPMHVT